MVPYYQLGERQSYPWFTAFEPKIQWREATLEEEYQPVVITTINT